jgi:hypothetical protein
VNSLHPLADDPFLVWQEETQACPMPFPAGAGSHDSRDEEGSMEHPQNAERPERRHPHIGESVVYHDSKGQAHEALITQVWGAQESPTMPSLNVVVISRDDQRMDSYGRQLERFTSVCHKSVQHAHGYYWRYVDEEPNPYQPPSG